MLVYNYLYLHIKMLIMTDEQMSNLNKTNANKNTDGEQKRMSERTGKLINRIVNISAALMFAMVVLLSKSEIKDKEPWISLVSAAIVAVIYTMAIYFRYGTFPETQKKLKAYVDCLANFLALCAIVLTFVSVKFFDKAESLPVMLAQSPAGNIIVGVIVGVLFARLLFPFWDMHSKYKKI
ncbi:hypothetical protein CBB52_004140 [Salmonella enterica]|nr:hypothetical protein [Salmonella enterica]EDX4865549.1 hypothetical protein [Salmonella enterica]EGN1942447.1 hypothetical protein [Salmonella enterica]